MLLHMSYAELRTESGRLKKARIPDLMKMIITIIIQ